MSLLKRNKDKQLAEEKKLAARHAIVKIGVDRNVRDAYFLGLAFAALANDDQIDESERTRLREFGEVLELSVDDVVESIQCLVGMDDDAKMDVIEECARQLTNVDVAEYFLKEFSELWFLGGGNKDEFDEFRSQLIDWMGDDVRMSAATKVKTAEEIEAKRKAEERLPSVEGDGQSAVEVWLSCVGPYKDTVNRILVESLPTAKKYPSWARGQINELDRIGQPVCFERKLDKCVALKVLARIRALGADGFLTDKEDFVLRPDDNAKGDVEVWLRRIGPNIEMVQNILVESLPVASKFPDWTRAQINEVARTGKSLCLEAKVGSVIASKVLSKLRAIGADCFTKQC